MEVVREYPRLRLTPPPVPSHSPSIFLYILSHYNSSFYFYSFLSRENELRERILVPHDNFFESIQSSRACCEGYFCLLFPWPVQSTFTWTWHVSPPNIWGLTALAPGADTNRLLLLTCFWSVPSAHNLGMNFIYKGIALLESKFHFEIKDWDFLLNSDTLWKPEAKVITRETRNL